MEYTLIKHLKILVKRCLQGPFNPWVLKIRNFEIDRTTMNVQLYDNTNCTIKTVQSVLIVLLLIIQIGNSACERLSNK